MVWGSGGRQVRAEPTGHILRHTHTQKLSAETETVAQGGLDSVGPWIWTPDPYHQHDWSPVRNALHWHPPQAELETKGVG